jgi:putative transposase
MGKNLKILKTQWEKKIQFWAYCLMDNHVHFIRVPKFPDSLSRSIGETHGRYTRNMHEQDGLWAMRILSEGLRRSQAELC